ncbi:MAG: class I SAM-dependent methyltransferase [Spirosomaceae bacterium]|nr:class I SAM-dependent methyltransferase [Spirosomataceae bacterium]
MNQSPKRVHKLLTEAVISGLDEIFFNNRKADQVVGELLKSNKKWGKRDRSFIAETIYEVVRWWRKMAFIANIETPTKEDLWQIVGAWFVLNDYDLPDWEEFAELNIENIKSRALEAEKTRAIRESIPDWLDEMGAAYFGYDWDYELKALNSPAEVYLRTNAIKINRSDLQNALTKREISTEQIAATPDTLQLIDRKNLKTNELFRKGFFEIQDAGSQLIAKFVNPKKGSFVIDACAGAGGKSLHLAALMENTGKIRSMDIDAKKLSELEFRAKRNGVKNINTVPIEKETTENYAGTADYLLMDVPCSGLGVLRRNPDAKWKITADFIEKIQATQAKILRNYAKMLKPDGTMVYATCSILPQENEEQVQKFLSDNPDFKLIEEKHLTPHKNGFDGFYMAKLKRG